MDLKDNELRSLMALLEPKFDSVEQRKAVLIEAFGKEDAEALGNIVNADHNTPDQFTTALLKTLHNDNIRIGSGKLALAQLLESMQAANLREDKPFSEAVQPFVDLLELPARSEANKLTTPAVVVSQAPAPVEVTVQKTHRRRKRRSLPVRMISRVSKVVRWQVIAIAILILVTVPPVSTLALVTDANARVQQSTSDVRRIMSTLSTRSLSELSLTDYQRLELAVGDLSDNLTRAQQQTSFLRRFSAFRSDLGTVMNTLDAATEVSLAANDMISGLKLTLFYLVNNNGSGQSGITAPNTQLSSGERIVELLTASQDRFKSASQHLDAAKGKLDNLNLQNVSPSLLLNAQELIKYYDKLQSLNEILLEAPDLLTKALGLTQDMRYLILSQNSDEIRPSGGYISTYGWMLIRRVQVADYGYGPTTDVSPNPPPASMASELQIPPWWIHLKNPVHTAWDGSWYADFAQTAQMAVWYYDNGNNPRSPIDGVVGIDLYGFEDLLQGLGSVTVPGYNEVVTAQNFRDVIYKIREETTTQEVAHKKFLSALYQQILQNWQHASSDQGTTILASMLRALQEKHIMFYFKDPKLNEAIALLGWSGTQEPALDHDYLMVADANDLGSKSNRSVKRSLAYDVSIQPDGSTQSRVSISYVFSETDAAQDPAVNPKNYSVIDYGNLMQVFVPANSVSTASSALQNPMITVPNSNYTEFVTDTVVKFGGSERFQISYSTPPIVKAYGPYHQYRLLLQKQPGTLGDPVDVLVTLPVDAQIVSVTPDPVTQYDLGTSILEFQTTLKTDQWIDIIYTTK